MRWCRRSLRRRKAASPRRLGFIYGSPNGIIQKAFVPDDGRRQFRAVADSESARAGQGSVARAERSRASAGRLVRRRQRRPRPRHRGLVERRARLGPPRRRRRRSVTLGTTVDQIAAAASRQGDAAALARAGPREADPDRLRQHRLLLLEHDFVAVADDPEPDGAASARGLRAAVRRRRHAPPSGWRRRARPAACSTR